MAIDTKKKRASIVGINYISGPGVIPNAVKSKSWRQSVGYGYVGIIPNAPTIDDIIQYGWQDDLNE